MSALDEFAAYARTLSPATASPSSAPAGAPGASSAQPQSKAPATSGGSPSQPGPVGANAAPVRAGPEQKAERKLGDGAIKRFAKWPNEAHQAWKNIPSEQQTLVVAQMASIYGSDFSTKFLEYTRSGADFTMTLDDRDHPADYFQKKGFRLVDTSDEPIDLSGPPGSEWQLWIHPSGQQVRWRPKPKATGGSDQDAFNAALDKLRKDIDPLKDAQGTVLAIQEHMDQGEPTDPDRQDEFDTYKKALEDFKSKIEAGLAQAKAIDQEYAPKGVDTSPLKPLVGKLNRLLKFINTALEPDNLAHFAPLLTSDEPPIDYSGH